MDMLNKIHFYNIAFMAVAYSNERGGATFSPLCFGNITNKYNIQNLFLRSGEGGHLKTRRIDVHQQQLRESICRVLGQTQLTPCIERC